MTLREIVASRPGLFYRQEWWHREPFADAPVVNLPASSPVAISHRVAGATLVSAGALAALYLADPDNPVWHRYIWTSDRDRWGQRVYVGGVCPENGHRFEIHRHLAIGDKWGMPVWHEEAA